MKKHPLEELAELLKSYRYDPETGKFFGKRGSEIGKCLDEKGYVLIDIKRVLYRAHRLAWFMSFGYFPLMLDHKNGDKSDNRLINLRECTASENMANKGPTRGKEYLGVFPCSTGYRVIITKNGKQYSKGTHTKIEDAAKAYDYWAKIMHGEFARLNFPKDHMT